jgi:outer membrane protein
MTPRHCLLRLFAALALAVPTASALWAQPAGPAVLDLDGALRLALENSHAIKQARERIRQEEGVLLEVRALDLPSVEASAQYRESDRGLLPSFGGQTFGAQRNWSADLTASYIVYAGGSVRAASAAQRAAVEAATLDLQHTIDSVLLAVRQTFYAVLLTTEQIEVQRQALALLQEEEATARRRYDAGAGSSFDLLRAEVAVANGRPPLIRAENTQRVLKQQLRQLLGLSDAPDDSWSIVGTLEYTPQSWDVASLLRQALAARPDLERLRRLEEAGVERVTAARSGALPQVSVYAGWAIQQSNFSNRLDDTLDGWVVGAQGRWAIFDGRATAGRVRAARSQLVQTQLAIEETVLAIQVEVRRAYSDFVEATQLVEASRETVRQAEEALRLARARFDAGAATQLDVLQSQVALTEARTNAVRALHDYNVALATLRRVAAVRES